MINLNFETGALQFYEWSFSSKDRLRDIEQRFSVKQLEPWTANSPWGSYRLNLSEDFVMIIMFHNQSIEYIELYPKGTSRNIQTAALQKAIRQIGGVKSYSWGNVEFNNDQKAGYQSIIIKYNR
jgi:hypothetical protein